MKLNKVLAAMSLMALSASANAAPSMKPTVIKPANDHKAIFKAVEHDHSHDHGLESDATHSKKANLDRRAPFAESITNNANLSPLSESQKVVACDLNAFTTSNTNTLIAALKSQGTTCINELFSAPAATQQAVYTSTKMIAVANHVQSLSQAYGGNGDDDIQALFLFMRAGFYVEFYNSNVSFSSSVTPAVKSAIDAFVNNANFYNDNDAHGKTLSEVIITMDSSEQQDVYLPVVKQWLSRWNQSYAGKWYMRSAVNGVFTLLFRGQWNSNFEATIANDTTLVANLRDFALSSWMIGHDAEFMAANAARELGRLKAYSNTNIQSSVDSALNNIFSTYQMYGNGDAIWLGAADTATYHGDCTSYNICNFKTDLEALVLGQIHTCSPTIRIRAQSLTSVQQQSACDKMGYEETLFHSKLQTNNQPVANDNNTQLQINIFNSSDDYGKYAGVIFGIGINNGGMYLEGDPSVVGNVPNFIAYEADYANADHYIWNLEHEYVHYLDGRFDLYGDFNAPTEDIVWWSEGVAEYIANEDNNQAAIDTVNDGSTYQLGEVFATTYDGFDQDRIYRWGYLAVRFMFERHQSEVNAMLASTRAGNWTAYKSRIDSWASAYGSEFTSWTQSLGGGTGNQAPSANANGPYSALVNATVSFSSAGSTDPDGSISSYSWNFGDGNSSTSANPNHSYSSAGSFTATLTVTDNDGATAASSASVTISNDTPTGSALTNGVGVAVSGAQDSETGFTLDVPAGASDLSFNIAGGTGDADLYVRFGAAPTQTVYDCRPYLGGNNETCDITNAQTGIYHVMLRGYNSYDTTLTGSFTASSGGGNLPDACATSGPITAGTLVAGQVTCVGSADPIWLTIGDVSSHTSLAITTANGSGNVDIQYKTGGWPSDTDNDGSSANAGNNECIYVTNTSQYWGYMKVSGGGSGASIVVDFDVSGCR